MLLSSFIFAWIAGYGLWNGTRPEKDDSKETAAVDIKAATFKLRMAPLIFERFCGNVTIGLYTIYSICSLFVDRHFFDAGDNG